MSKNMYPITNAGVFIVCVNNVNVDKISIINTIPEDIIKFFFILLTPSLLKLLYHL